MCLSNSLRLWQTKAPDFALAIDVIAYPVLDLPMREQAQGEGMDRNSGEMLCRSLQEPQLCTCHCWVPAHLPAPDTQPGSIHEAACASFRHRCLLTLLLYLAHLQQSRTCLSPHPLAFTAQHLIARLHSSAYWCAGVGERAAA